LSLAHIRFFLRILSFQPPFSPPPAAVAAQVAGGVAALAMSMFTGCFPLFGDAGATRGVGYYSFLRYSAQLLFRAE